MKTTHFAEKSFFSLFSGPMSSSSPRHDVQQEEEQQQQQRRRWRWRTTAAESPFVVVVFRKHKKKITRIPRNKTFEQPNNRQHIFSPKFFHFLVFFVCFRTKKREQH
jgi:hypothetical protein